MSDSLPQMNTQKKCWKTIWGPDLLWLDQIQAQSQSGHLLHSFHQIHSHLWVNPAPHHLPLSPSTTFQHFWYNTTMSAVTKPCESCSQRVSKIFYTFQVYGVYNQLWNTRQKGGDYTHPIVNLHLVSLVCLHMTCLWFELHIPRIARKTLNQNLLVKSFPDQPPQRF